ncbi:hypothetical protein MTP99_003742 [Tenebrio molitor]|nr:hypothetical protein MTP99_003742 [Tenebrio molitor]CAH1379898.1 unnamed protein product [Tenebrio molitor]
MPPKVQGVSRSGRMSKQQKELLINRLELDRFLLHQEKLNPAELKKYNYVWAKLSTDLNGLQGAKKTVIQWKEALNELKVNTRRKARLLHQEATGTGGGPKKLRELSQLEERLMALISKVVITGVSTIPEAGIILTEPTEPERNNVVDETDPNIYQEIIAIDELLANEEQDITLVNEVTSENNNVCADTF